MNNDLSWANRFWLRKNRFITLNVDICVAFRYCCGSGFSRDFNSLAQQNPLLQNMCLLIYTTTNSSAVRRLDLSSRTIGITVLPNAGKSSV